MSSLKQFLNLSWMAILLFASSSCGHKPVPVIEPRVSSDLRDFPLGNSGYRMRLPYHYHLEEANGKEGQLGYHIITGDPRSTTSAFIEIRKGMPVVGEVRTLVPGDVFAKAYLLDRQVEWRIDSLETGYYEAFTRGSDDLNAHISAKDRNEIDQMVSLIATLRKS